MSRSGKRGRSEESNSAMRTPTSRKITPPSPPRAHTALRTPKALEIVPPSPPRAAPEGGASIRSKEFVVPPSPPSYSAGGSDDEAPESMTMEAMRDVVASREKEEQEGINRLRASKLEQEAWLKQREQTWAAEKAAKERRLQQRASTQSTKIPDGVLDALGKLGREGPVEDDKSGPSILAKKAAEEARQRKENALRRRQRIVDVERASKVTLKKRSADDVFDAPLDPEVAEYQRQRKQGVARGSVRETPRFATSVRNK